MVHPNRGVVSHAVNVKQEEHEEISLLSAQVTGGGGRRTASLKTKGRMIQLKLKIIYNETTQNKDKDDVVVVLNKQYPPRSDKNGCFRGHDEEFSSLAGTPLELYDEDGDKVDGASFSGVTKGSFLKFEDHMYAVEVVDDSTPFEKETAIATSQPDLATDGNGTAKKRRVSDIGGKEVLLNNTAKKRRRWGEVDDVVNDDVIRFNDNRSIVTYPIYTSTGSLVHADAGAFPCRFYRQTFKGKTFGLQLVDVDGHIVVAKNVTGCSKPALGDVLFRANNYYLPLCSSRCTLNNVSLLMRQMLSDSGGVELSFKEVPRFWFDVAEPILKKREANGRRNAQL